MRRLSTTPGHGGQGEGVMLSAPLGLGTPGWRQAAPGPRPLRSLPDCSDASRAGSGPAA